MTSFDQILFGWLGLYPKGRCPNDVGPRQEALKVLFTKFKKEGYPKEYFTSAVKGKITFNSMNPNHKKRKERRIWKECVARDLEIAFEAIYPEKVDMEENGLLAKPVFEEDLSAELEKSEEYIKEDPKEPKKPKIEYFAENAPKGSPTVNQIDPEMAELLGLIEK